MFFRKKKTEKVDIDHLFERASQGSLALQAVIGELNSEINSLITTIHDKDEIIRQKDEIIRQKDERILHLEAVIHSNEPMVDEESKLYNVAYYRKFIRPILDDSYYILTITFKEYEHKFDYFYRQDIATVIRHFTSNSTMTPVLWQEDTIKIFLRVDASKSERLRDEITNMLRSQIREKEIHLSFRHYRDGVEV